MDNRQGVDEILPQITAGDPLFLHSSDHPAMVLVTTPLTEFNYVSWSQSMTIALGAKVKLGFVNGTCQKPDDENSPYYQQWKRVDCMVVSWILNSVSKDIADGFLFTTSAQQLWSDLADWYGVCNGHLLYQIKREISSINQGNMTVVTYFSRLKRLWDELACLRPFPRCSCGSAKMMMEIDNDDKLLKFVMGLNETFDGVRNQILMMEPLPSINKAYSMVIKVEKQKAAHTSFGDLNENNAMTVRFAVEKKGSIGQGHSGRKDTSLRKSELKCDHCGIQGHTKDSCFKLHGYPNWWKGKREQPGKGTFADATTISAHTSFDSPVNQGITGGQNWQSLLAEKVQQKVGRVLKGKGKEEGSQGKGNEREPQEGDTFSFARFNNFTGTNLSRFPTISAHTQFDSLVSQGIIGGQNWQSLLAEMVQQEVGRVIKGKDNEEKSQEGDMIKGKAEEGEPREGDTFSFARFNDFTGGQNWQSLLAEMVQQEVGRVRKGKGKEEESREGYMTSFTSIKDFAGPSE